MPQVSRANRAEFSAPGPSASGIRPLRRWRWIAALVFLVAAGLRVWAGIELSEDIRVIDPILDGRYYLDLGERLSAGEPWPDEPHFMTPLYPAVLSIVFRLGPVSVVTIQVFQAILGLATLFVLFMTVRRDLGTGAALGAGAMFALYAPVLASESQVLVESLLLFLCSVAMWFWPRRGDGYLRPLLFGVVAGLLALGRGVFLMLPAAAAVLLVLGGRRRGGAGLKPTVCILIGLFAALLPCAIHQTRATGRLTVLTLNGGINLYVGNNPSARGVYSQPSELDLENDPTGARSASILSGQRLNMSESSLFWARRALGFARESPQRSIRLLLRKAALYFSPNELPQIEAFELLREEHLPLRAAFLDFTWILPLAVLGGGGWLYSRRSAGRRCSSQDPSPLERPARHEREELVYRLEPYLILVVVGWIATIIFFATGRYRIPYMVGFFAAAGCGLSVLCGHIHARRVSWRLAVIPVVVGLQFAIPGYSMDSVRAHDAYQRGIRLQRSGDPMQALEAYRKVLELDPDGGEAWHGIGAALASLGRLPEAAAAYERAAALLPRTALTHYNLGIVLGRLGQDEAALGWFRRAAALDPFDPSMRSDLGVALARLGRYEEAAEQFREALRLDPSHESSRRYLRRLSP